MNNIGKPFYHLQEEDKKYIIGFLETCKTLDFGNVSFQYYAVPERMYDIFFYLTKYANHWELMVKHQKQDNTKIFWSLTDIYKIIDDEIEYDYSEKDML